MTALRIPSGPLRGVELETSITGNPRVQRIRLRFRAMKRRLGLDRPAVSISLVED
ncbi:MAG: hypothetical protein U0Y82_02390 [Thermoleophilia bacterium]